MSGVGFAGDGGADDVDDAQGAGALRPLAPRMAARVSAVSPDWEMDDDEGALLDGAVAVADFAGVFDFGRQRARVSMSIRRPGRRASWCRRRPG